MGIDRVVLVTKRTTLEELVVRFQTRAQAEFYLTQAGESFAPIVEEHDAYHQLISELRKQIPGTLKYHQIDRDLLPQYQFRTSDLVVTLGPDGLVVNTAKYLDGQPVIPVNPDPERIDGILCPVTNSEFGTVFTQTLAERGNLKRVTMAEARLSDGQRLLAVNDLFIGSKSHVSARYRLSYGGQAEFQSSSGVIVSTGAGSTGWMRSIHASALAVAGALDSGISAGMPKPLPWDTQELLFAVREPFPGVGCGTELVYGRASDEVPLSVVSMMPRNGVIFSDGIEADFLEFNSGAVAEITLADRTLLLSV
ncbi:hypothetical protein [Natronospira bacteriovora]